MKKVFEQQCVELRKQDKSIDEIATITGRAKSSIYPYIKDTPLSEGRKKLGRQKKTRAIIAFNKGRRGKSALGRKPKKFYTWNRNKVLLIGHLLFDGEVSRTSCVYTNSSVVLICRSKKLMEGVYPYPPKETESTPGVQRISYHNVELASYIKDKQIELLNKILRLNTGCKKAFLQSFFDDEGSVYAIKNKRLVRGYQYDYGILVIVKTLLKDFGIESNIYEKYNEIVISRKENLIKFRDEINFSPGVKINGKRKNSVWKKDLEKRKILDMAIESYQN